MASKAGSLTTGPVRLSFPALKEPKPVSKDKPDDKKFQATLILPPDMDLKPFYDAVKAVMLERWGKLIKLPARNNPIKSNDEKELDGYEDGGHFINTRSKRRPKCVDGKVQDVIDIEEVFYPGCWVRAHINAYAWEHPQGGKGVSFGLNAVQFFKDGERFDGAIDVSEAFDAVPVADDEIFGGDDEVESSLFGGNGDDEGDEIPF